MLKVVQHATASALNNQETDFAFLLLPKSQRKEKKKKKKRKDSAGSDDTASMIKGGGYLGARTRQPPTAQTIVKKILIWVRGVVCRSTRTQSLTVVACVILQCIPCFYECRCMSDGVFVQFVCQFLNLIVIQIKVCQMFICIIFVDSPHNSNEDHMKLDFPISLSV